MAIEITGKLVCHLQAQTGSGKNGQWTKQEFVIETIEQYPKKVCLEAWNDKVDMVKTLQAGTQLTVSFNPESREFNGKWYTNLRVWKIDLAGGAPQGQNNFAAAPPPSDFPPFPDAPPLGGTGDLPF